MQCHKNVRRTFFAGKLQILLASDEPTGDKSERYGILSEAELVSFILKRTLRSKTEPRRGAIPLFSGYKKVTHRHSRWFFICAYKAKGTSPDA